MADIILHLGGNTQRAETAAKVAQQFPESKIVVSSELGDYFSIYDAHSIPRDRIIVNNEAWDTVTNFTHTYKLLKELNCTRIFVVTDQFHTYRSMLIALAIWGGKVPIYICPHQNSINEGDEKIALEDFLRGLLWRTTRVLVYWKSVYEERKQYYQASSGHSRYEIGL